MNPVVTAPLTSCLLLSLARKGLGGLTSSGHRRRGSETASAPSPPFCATAVSSRAIHQGASSKGIHLNKKLHREAAVKVRNKFHRTFTPTEETAVLVGRLLDEIFDKVYALHVPSEEKRSLEALARSPEEALRRASTSLGALALEYERDLRSARRTRVDKGGGFYRKDPETETERREAVLESGDTSGSRIEESGVAEGSESFQSRKETWETVREGERRRDKGGESSVVPSRSFSTFSGSASENRSAPIGQYNSFSQASDPDHPPAPVSSSLSSTSSPLFPFPSDLEIRGTPPSPLVPRSPTRIGHSLDSSPSSERSPQGQLESSETFERSSSGYALVSSGETGREREDTIEPYVPPLVAGCFWPLGADLDFRLVMDALVERGHFLSLPAVPRHEDPEVGKEPFEFRPFVPGMRLALGK
eukprot:Cvel_22346.t1-p1 / transcript=Cvel_22346.t1 / gene=Cvel_22346 / organism=Chromera_velia_CCMP2878 / gene_product=hypothetical protein / transcript_product=hypothetical protein / location=Cvel_scaffold2188:227-1943(-) / protein_length=417 / sequence_SO=supercontig / SO=protein_coding / is_pseudo=false